MWAHQRNEKGGEKKVLYSISIWQSVMLFLLPSWETKKVKGCSSLDVLPSASLKISLWPRQTDSRYARCTDEVVERYCKRQTWLDGRTKRAGQQERSDAGMTVLHYITSHSTCITGSSQLVRLPFVVDILLLFILLEYLLLFSLFHCASSKPLEHDEIPAGDLLYKAYDEAL